MNLDPVADQAKLLLLKNWVNANHGGAFDQSAADALNAPAGPAVWGFRSSVPVQTVIDSIVPAEYLVLASQAATTNLHHNGLDLLLRNGVFRPGPESARNWLVALLPTGTAAASRANLLNNCTRQLTVGEGLLAVNGTGPGGGNGTAQNASRVLGVNAAGSALEGEVTLQNVVDSASA